MKCRLTATARFSAFLENPLVSWVNRREATEGGGDAATVDDQAVADTVRALRAAEEPKALPVKGVTA
jgi:hypothetical protein